MYFFLLLSTFLFFNNPLCPCLSVSYLLTCFISCLFSFNEAYISCFFLLFFHHLFFKSTPLFLFSQAYFVSSFPPFLVSSHVLFSSPSTPSVHGHMQLCRWVPLFALQPLASTCCKDPNSSNEARALPCGQGYEAVHCLEHKNHWLWLNDSRQGRAKHCGPNSIFRIVTER